MLNVPRWKTISVVVVALAVLVCGATQQIGDADHLSLDHDGPGDSSSGAPLNGEGEDLEEDDDKLSAEGAPCAPLGTGLSSEELRDSDSWRSGDWTDDIYRPPDSALI